MAEGRLLRKLIRAGARTKSDEFGEIAQELIQQERAKKHHLLANDLERILFGEQSDRPRALQRRPDVPKDERGLALIEIHAPKLDLADLVLSDQSVSALEQVILEQNRRDLIRSYGLRPSSKLLLYGPPGCGKTSAAEALANELGVELGVVRLDAVMSSYLGESASNLRRVFEFVEQERIVLLFDEFDSVGKERGDDSDHGELKRVVNAFLQMLDAYRGTSILLAATNHERLLDKALWRRFDEVVCFDKPNLEQVRRLLTIKTRAIRSDLPLSDTQFVNRFTGMSHSDIERVLVRAIKDMILKGREFLSKDLVTRALEREVDRRRQED